MMPANGNETDKPTGVEITVEYKPDGHGRLSKVFHLFDPEGREVKLSQKDAVKMAKSVMKIAKEK